MEIIGTSEATRLLGVSSTRVVQLVVAGTLPARKVGGRYVFKLEDVNALGLRREDKARSDKRMKVSA